MRTKQQIINWLGRLKRPHIKGIRHLAHQALGRLQHLPKTIAINASRELRPHFERISKLRSIPPLVKRLVKEPKGGGLFKSLNHISRGAINYSKKSVNHLHKWVKKNSPSKKDMREAFNVAKIVVPIGVTAMGLYSGNPAMGLAGAQTSRTLLDAGSKYNEGDYKGLMAMGVAHGYDYVDRKAKQPKLKQTQLPIVRRNKQSIDAFE